MDNVWNGKVWSKMGKAHKQNKSKNPKQQQKLFHGEWINDLSTTFSMSYKIPSPAFYVLEPLHKIIHVFLSIKAAKIKNELMKFIDTFKSSRITFLLTYYNRLSTLCN